MVSAGGRLNAQMAFDTLTLDQLEVFGIRNDITSPVKKTMMDTLVIRNMNNLDLGELLSAYSPVFIKSYGPGNLATASFRGTGASHTQVLWNGFSINSPMLGQVDFSQVPNSFFDQVALYYGGASLEQNSGALGGSVLLMNDYRQSGLNIEQTAGSFGTFRTFAGFKTGHKKFGSDTRLVFKTSRNDFPYYNNAILPPREMRQVNGNYTNTAFTQQFIYQINPSNCLKLSTWNQWDFREVPTAMTNVDRREGHEEYQKDFFSRNIAEWTRQKDKSKLEVRGAYFYEDFNYYLKTTSTKATTGNVDLVDSKNRSNGIFGKAAYSYAFSGTFLISAGLDAGFDRISSNNYGKQEERNSLSIYSDFEKKFKDRLILNLLIRARMVDGKLLPPMPLFGINYRLLKTRQLAIRANVSRNYHIPTLNDLYWNPGGNTALLPEDAIETEAGVNYLFRKPDFYLRTDVSVYASWIKDWIQWVPSEYVYWEPRNIANVFARGLEFSAHFTGNLGKFGYQVSAGYAFTKTTDESEMAKVNGHAGRQMIYVPLNSANGNFYFTYKNYYLSWGLYFTGKRNTALGDDVSGSDSLPGYMLNNIGAGKIWERQKTNFEIRVQINNLFNVNYQAVLWRAMPGRNYELSFKFHFK